MTEHTHDPDTGEVIPAPPDHEHGQDDEATEPSGVAPDHPEADTEPQPAQDDPEDDPEG